MSNILEILGEVDNKEMTGMLIQEPSLLKTNTGLAQYYSINNYVRNQIYKAIELKAKLSADLFGLDAAIWRSVIDNKYKNSELDFNEMHAYVFRGTIIDTIKEEYYDESLFNKFVELIEKYNATGTYNTSDNLVIRIRNNQSIAIVTMNFLSGWYALHVGVIDNDKFVIYPKAEIEGSGFIAFMNNFVDSFEGILEGVNKISENTNDAKALGFNLEENLSLRELLDILKIMNCGVALNDEKHVASISGMSTENSNVIVNVLDSYGMTYKSLKKLSYLRKVCRHTTISAEEILKILTQELLSDESALNIHGYVFSMIGGICLNEEFDYRVLKEEISN